MSALHRNITRFHTFLFGLAIALQMTFAFSATAGDTRVWVNTNSGVYHCPGGQYYGNTKRGMYVVESEAIERGYRAAYHQPCSPQVAERATNAVVQHLAPANGAVGTIEVWINTSSGVYHCPGTRYYGATKRGRYAREAEAVSAGNRPAYGQRCR